MLVLESLHLCTTVSLNAFAICFLRMMDDHFRQMGVGITQKIDLV
jgi:hypothetical protein